MKQYGDITQLNGAELDPVDLIVGGSPCQDLSVAGKRAGLEGERSGLFMEMIRIIKEMRNATNFIRPRYALWENVPGAFSSNKGEDFRAVLTEFVRVAEPDAPDVPMPKKKWDKSGVLLGSGWSIAYRTFDAQYWGKTIRDSRTGDVLAMGTPQRRRRIALVADFRGQTAPQILFELSCLPGNPHEESEEGKGIAGNPSESLGSAMYWNGSQVINTLTAHNANGAQRMPDKDNFQAVISFQERAGKPGGGKGILIQDEHTGALSTLNNQAVLCVNHDEKDDGRTSNI